MPGAKMVPLSIFLLGLGKKVLHLLINISIFVIGPLKTRIKKCSKLLSWHPYHIQKGDQLKKNLRSQIEVLR